MWIARFGVPLRVTTYQGWQFETKFFNELARLIGMSHLGTTEYYSSENGMVEKLNRQFKICKKNTTAPKWMDQNFNHCSAGIRTAIKEDLNASTAEMVYGWTIRLPGDFSLTNKKDCNSVFIKKLRKHIQHLKPLPTTRHKSKKHYFSRNWLLFVTFLYLTTPSKFNFNRLTRTTNNTKY